MPLQFWIMTSYPGEKICMTYYLKQIYDFLKFNKTIYKRNFYKLLEIKITTLLLKLEINFFLYLFNYFNF